MTHYILIDNASGFIWGECFADNPEMACRLVDEGLGESGREYAEVGSLDADETGYHAYEAPADRKFISDGQNQENIAAVMAMPRAAIIQVVSWEDFQ